MRGRFVHLTVVVMLVAVVVRPQRILAQSTPQELFAVFHPDSANNHCEPGVVVILQKADWDKLLASVGNPSAGAVDFSTEAVLVVTGQFLGVCRNTAAKGVAKTGDGRVKVSVEETYPEKCSGGAVCRCSLIAGIPPPVGNTVIALKVQKPVTSAEVETISVVDKCCPAK